MIDVQKQVDQLEALANEVESIANLACDQATQEHNKRIGLELREASARMRIRQGLAAEG
jgi:hypothetical protein